MATYSNVGYIEDEEELNSIYIRRDDYVAKGQIGTYNTVTGTFDLLPVGTNGYVLSADSASSYGLTWIAAPNEDIQAGTSGAQSGASGLTITTPSSSVTTLALANSGVVAGVYGSATDVPVITVDARGRITAAANTAIAGGSALESVPTDNWFAGTGRVVNGSRNVGVGHLVNTGGVGDDKVLLGYAASSTAGSSIAIGAGATITSGVESCIIGPFSLAQVGTRNIVLGYSSVASYGGIAIGPVLNIQSTTPSIAVGRSLIVGGTGPNVFVGDTICLPGVITAANNIAVGVNLLPTLTSGVHNVCLGINNDVKAVNTQYSVNVGSGNSVATNGVSIGALNLAGSGRSIQIGYDNGNSGSSGVDNIVLGFGAGKALTTAANNVLIGFQAGDNITSSNGNVIIGTSTTLTSGLGQNVVVGDLSALSTTTTNRAVVIGRVSTGATSSVAIGDTCQATGATSVAIGDNVSATSARSISIGCNGTFSTNTDAISFGSNARSSGNQSVTIGNNTIASGARSMVLGSDITNNRQNSIIIGNGLNPAQARSQEAVFTGFCKSTLSMSACAGFSTGSQVIAGATAILELVTTRFDIFPPDRLAAVDLVNDRIFLGNIEDYGSSFMVTLYIVATVSAAGSAWNLDIEWTDPGGLGTSVICSAVIDATNLTATNSNEATVVNVPLTAAGRNYVQGRITRIAGAATISISNVRMCVQRLA